VPAAEDEDYSLRESESSQMEVSQSPLNYNSRNDADMAPQAELRSVAASPLAVSQVPVSEEEDWIEQAPFVPICYDTVRIEGGARMVL